MTSRLSMLVLAIAVLGCEDDPAPKKGFLEPCTAQTSSSCSPGSAGEGATGCEIEDNCEEGLTCRVVGLGGTLCTKACAGNAECAGVAPSAYVGLCNAGNCTVTCTLNDDCSGLGLTCQNSTHCAP